MGVRDKVAPCVQAAVADRGYQGVTYEGIAAASGVAKTTLYRHWPSRAEMVFELVVHDRRLPSLVCEPTIEAAAQVLADRVVGFMSDGLSGQVIAAVLADMAADEVLSERLRAGFLADGRHEVTDLLQRTGLAPVPGLDVGDLQLILLGAVQAWLTVGGISPADAADRAAKLAASLLQKAQLQEAR